LLGYLLNSQYLIIFPKTQEKIDSLSENVSAESDVYRRAELVVNQQVETQTNGYPLIENPFNGGFQLDGNLSNIERKTVKLEDGFNSHLQGEFSYKDINGTIQRIMVPLIIENTELQMTQLFTGVADSLFEESMLDVLMSEEFQQNSVGPHQIQLLLSTRNQLKEEFYGTKVIADLISSFYPNGFEAFRKNGEKSNLERRDWLIPMEISFK
jgi:hypothetical protein